MKKTRIFFDPSALSFILDALGFYVQDGIVIHRKTKMPVTKDGRYVKTSEIVSISKENGFEIL